MTNFGWKVEATQKGKGAWIQAQYTKAISLVAAIFIGLIGGRLYLRRSNVILPFPPYLDHTISPHRLQPHSVNLPPSPNFAMQIHRPPLASPLRFHYDFGDAKGEYTAHRTSSPLRQFHKFNFRMQCEPAALSLSLSLLHDLFAHYSLSLRAATHFSILRRVSDLLLFLFAFQLNCF